MWLYGWEILTVSQHPAKFTGHEHCGSGHVIFLICHETRRSKFQTAKNFFLKDMGRRMMKAKWLAQSTATYHGVGRGGVYVLPQTTEFINLPTTERRFLQHSAEGRRVLICLSRKLMKSLCLSSQFNFSVPQKKKSKKYSLTFFQTQANSF